MTVRNRVIQALAANAFGQGISVGAQLLLTPLYFMYWGASQYGEWLMLSTIPAYLVMADVGIGSAAANEMTMRVGANDYSGAQQTFWGAVRFTHFITFFCIAASSLLALLTTYSIVLPLQHISKTDAATCIFLLGIGVCLHFYLGIISSGFRCSGKNAQGILLSNLVRLAEFLLSALVLVLAGTPVALCIGLTAARCAGLLLQTILLRRACAWIFAAGYVADRKIFSRLIKPSLSFLALPLGNAIALQGPVLIIGGLFGSASVAAFSAMRTLSRIPLQIANVFNASVWPEISSAFGARNFGLMRKLHQQSWLATLLLGISTSAAILLTGKLVVTLWLKDSNLYDGNTLLALTSMASLAAIWGISSIVLTAINAHTNMVAIYLLVNSVSMALAYLLGRSFGMTWFLVPLVLAEISMLLVVYPIALRVTKDSFPMFLRGEWENLCNAYRFLRA